MFVQLASSKGIGHRRPSRFVRFVTGGCLVALIGMAVVVISTPTARADTQPAQPATASLSADTQPEQLIAATLSDVSLASSLSVVPLSAVSLVTHMLGLTYPTIVVQGLALTVVPVDQLWSFNQIISHESSWNVFAVNPSSGAYGLPQALPAWKMSSAGIDWLFNPLTQLRWAYRYMCDRYGSPNAAWDFWQEHHWY